MKGVVDTLEGWTIVIVKSFGTSMSNMHSFNFGTFAPPINLLVKTKFVVIIVFTVEKMYRGLTWSIGNKIFRMCAHETNTF